MQEGMPLRDHRKNLNKILLDLRNVDIKVEDEDAALIMLVSLSESYKNFVESFMTGKETLSLEDVRSALHIREDRQKATSSATENLASGLSVTGKGQKKQNSKSSKGPKATDDICRYCKEPGHWKVDCPNIKKKLGKKEDANGASYHLCPHMEYFTTYEQIDGGKLPWPTVLSSRWLASAQSGSGPMMGFKGEGGVIRILKGSKVVLTALKRGTLYVLRGSIVANSADIASSEVAIKDMTKLWHMRLGHMGERGIRIMPNRDFLSGNKVQFSANTVYWESFIAAKDLEGVDKQVELQVTHDESESQLQGGEDQHTTAEVTTDTTSSDVHTEARQRSIAIDRARRTGVKPPLKYDFEDMMAYALQVTSEPDLVALGQAAFLHN
ncbi:hypothetical protein SASPL_154157 [Salvia splendens]|uniref:CCHC-type domain-containing protein n=1 Tax=Salvia splendens TaxID=180675 RepID=A0A8X8VZN9_SALSN|nr:hypothetical protein SASPL_154157 [Salvia splendens]